MDVFMRNSVFVFCLSLLLCACQPKGDLILLCTNDTHSQVEVCGANMKKMSGLGGYAYRAGLIDSLRNENPELLLLDAGDFSQGTPYFNLYRGRVEILAYNQMRYDAVTLGNHEFDNGVDTLAARLREASFEVVCTNYAVEGTPLEGIVKKSVVFERAGWKVGVIGLGVNPDGLILKSNFGGVRYLDPLEVANAYADSLKQQCDCDAVILLSHLGSSYDDENTMPSDEYIAQHSRSIDVIVGGHTHKQVEKKCVNLNGDSVLLVQTGKSGAYLGKIKLRK